MPFSLRELQEKVKHSKIKLYHGDDIELQVQKLTHKAFGWHVVISFAKGVPK